MRDPILVASLPTSQMCQGQGIDWMWFTFGLGNQELDEWDWVVGGGDAFCRHELTSKRRVEN